MKIYLASPMSGYQNFNFPAFHAAAKGLRELGHFVFNPAERDMERDGVSWGDEVASGDLAEAAAKGFDRRAALLDDLTWIIKEAEAIALLPGWYKSSGAKAELATAQAFNLVVMELPTVVT